MNINANARPPILEQMSALADGLRGRILLVLERNELTVSELRAVLQLPQSTVSRHLKTLGDAGWVASRRDGTRRLYHMPDDDAGPGVRRLWGLARDELGGTRAAEEDLRRLGRVLAERRSRSREFFTTEAGRWDLLRDELFGRRFYLQALLGLLADDWVVGDLGCGSGPLSEALAPCVRQVIAVDGSEAMLGAARRRLRDLDNVDVRRGELEALPIDDGVLDAATLILVLHHLPEPGKAVQEVARVLRPGGALLVVDMLPHDRQEYHLEMGHVWMGFSRPRMEQYLGEAGLRPSRFRILPAEPEAKGPTLFAVTAKRDSQNS